MNSIASVTVFTGQMADDPDIPGLAAAIVDEAGAIVEQARLARAKQRQALL